MKNNINKYLKKCLIYGQRPFAPTAANPYNFLKFIRKINVKYLMNNNKNSIIDNNIIYFIKLRSCYNLKILTKILV